LDAIDVEEIATALADRTDYEHRWLIDPPTGDVAFWTSDTGIDGEIPVEFDELDLVLIDPLPSYVWYQDMVDFADGISDRAAGERLRRSLQGKGAFRRFKNELYQGHPDLIAAWHAFRDARARARAVQWLAEEGLIDRTLPSGSFWKTRTRPFRDHCPGGLTRYAQMGAAHRRERASVSLRRVASRWDGRSH
jgi:hypothetical protein